MNSPSPITSSVTPCLMSLCERPSTIRESLAQLSMLMKPGATASPGHRSPCFPAWPSQVANLCEGVALDPNIRHTRRIATAVVERAVADDDIIRRALSAGGE
ncbi:MAG: hypothetical protein U0V70_02345 [Terriglobia bacterium]